MRLFTLRTLLASGVAVAMLATGCERPASPPQAAAGPAAAAPQVIPPPAVTEPAPPATSGAVAQIQELHPATQEVKAPPPSASSLQARERRLAQREAAVAAREQATQTSAEPAPAPAADSQPEPGAEMTEASEPPPIEAAPPAEPVTLPGGTPFDVEFTKALASNTSTVGESFRARVVADVSVYGQVVIPAGSEVLGEVTDAQGVRGIGARAKLGLKFTDLVLPSGSTVPIHASLLQEGTSKAGKDAATIGGATAGGALLGRILSSARGGRGTIIGALIGAATGTAIASRTAGQEVVIPEGSVISLRLDGSVEVRPPPAR
jgi:type IV secretory pathway VirB10-like protein